MLGSLVLGSGIGQRLIGSESNDFIFAFGGGDVLKGGSGRDWLFGGNGNDVLKGGSGIDFLLGGNGNDNLSGGAGNDPLYGGNGNDALKGGKGNDRLTGGAGVDMFVFKSRFDYDVITDFSAGNVLQFDPSVFANSAAVAAKAVQVGADVVITYDAANTVTLIGVVLANAFPSPPPIQGADLV